MSSSFSFICTMFAGLLSVNTLVIADTVTLINGDHFSGTLRERDGKRMIFRTEYVGVVRIRWEHIRSLNLDKTALLQFDNGDSIRILSVEIDDQQITYTNTRDGQSYQLDAKGITGFSPEAWIKNEQGYLTGRANVAIKSDRGNGDADFVDLDVDLTYRRRIDRFRLNGEWELDNKYSESTGRKRISKDRWSSSGTYSYFLDKKTFLTGMLALEHDRQTDLQLRTVSGPLLGYQFYESQPLNLLFEAGVLWVDEDYIAAPDNTTWHPAWHFNFDKYISKNFLQLYHEHYSVLTAGDADNWYVRSWTGLRVPVGRSLQASVEYKLDYDNQTVNDNESSESTLRLKLGYKW